jgi:hypothetical protein
MLALSSTGCVLSANPNVVKECQAYRRRPRDDDARGEVLVRLLQEPDVVPRARDFCRRLLVRLHALLGVRMVT